MPVTKLAPSILMRMGQVHRRTPMNRNGLLGSMSHHHRRDPTPPHQRLRPKIDQKGLSNRGRVRYESSGVRAAGLIRISMFSGSELANQARDINRQPNYGVCHAYCCIPCHDLHLLSAVGHLASPNADGAEVRPSDDASGCYGTAGAASARTCNGFRRIAAHAVGDSVGATWLTLGLSLASRRRAP
jgi:hypothetical protein